MNLILGDCLEELKKLPNNSVDSIVTDPPYELGFMGKKWDNSGIAYNINLWKECLRVLKSGGHLLAFGGTRTYHRMAVAIEDAGFEVRDMLEWIYASGFPKSLNVGKAVKAKELTGGSSPKNLRQSRMGCNYEPTGQKDYRKGRMFSAEIVNDNTKEEINNEWEGFGTALKPAHEPIIMARKPLSEKTIVENVLKHGTGGIDIDGCRIPTSEVLVSNGFCSGLQKKCKEQGARPYVNGFAGEKFTPTINKTGGRFPANIICTDDALGVEKSRYFDIDVWAEKHGLLQFPKASKRERNEGCEGLETSKKFTAGNYSQSPTCKTCDLTLNGTNDHSECSGEVYYKEMESKNTKNNHPTVKPVHLMSWLIKLVTPPKGVCLDPFMGSGSTGVACRNLGYDFIGIEREAEYIKIAEARIKEEE